MNTLNLSKEEIARAIETFDARTLMALRRAPLSLLLTLFNPIVTMGLAQDAGTADWADTLHALCLDHLVGLSQDKIDDLRKQLLVVIGVEIDRRFPVPA